MDCTATHQVLSLTIASENSIENFLCSESKSHLVAASLNHRYTGCKVVNIFLLAGS
jgi:hypothetical protein